MSTTPFRAAFWAMGLACAMTALLMVPNPQKIRAALMAQRNHTLLPFERALLEQEAATDDAQDELLAAGEHSTQDSGDLASVTDQQHIAEPHLNVVAEVPSQQLPSVEVSREPVLAQNDPQVDQEKVATAPATAQASPFPIQVANVDSNLKIELPVTGFPALTIEDLPEAMTSEQAPVVAESHTGNRAEFDVQQGDPFKGLQPHRGVTPVPMLAPLDTQPISAHPFSSDIAEAKNVRVPDPIQQTARVSANPELGHLSSQSLESLGRNENGVVLQVTAGDEAGKWNFKFKNAPIDEALQLIGDQTQTRVIVDSSIEGTYTGDLRNVESNLALGIIVKVHRLSVSHRGNIVLIRPGNEEKNRLYNGR